jgi:hypothetical protein
MVEQPMAIEIPAVGFARTVSQTFGQRWILDGAAGSS